MWDSYDELDRELRDLGSKGVQRNKVTWESDDEFSVDTDQVREAVEYTARGCGSNNRPSDKQGRFFIDRNARHE